MIPFIFMVLQKSLSVGLEGDPFGIEGNFYELILKPKSASEISHLNNSNIRFLWKIIVMFLSPLKKIS